MFSQQRHREDCSRKLKFTQQMFGWTRSKTTQNRAARVVSKSSGDKMIKKHGWLTIMEQIEFQVSKTVPGAPKSLASLHNDPQVTLISLS